MNKFGVDPKVKKTLVRDSEKKTKPLIRNQAVRDVGSTSRLSGNASRFSMNENVLDKPSMCSSEALATYMSDVRQSAPPPLKAEDLNIDKCKISAKVTKNLNFHYNDRIYRNLIELNANVDDVKKRKDRKPISPTRKKDLEPNIEDFTEEIADVDNPPIIPVIKPKFKMVKKVENGQLHKLLTSVENL